MALVTELAQRMMPIAGQHDDTAELARRDAAFHLFPIREPMALLTGRPDDLDSRGVSQRIPLEVQTFLVAAGRVKQQITVAREQLAKGRLSHSARPDDEDALFAFFLRVLAEPGVQLREFLPDLVFLLPQP